MTDSKQTAESVNVESDPMKYFDYRKDLVLEAKKQGREMYPHKFNVTISIEEFLHKYSHIEVSQSCEDVVSIAGRVTRIAPSGKDLRFLRVRSGGFEVQVMADKRKHTLGTEDYRATYKAVHRGDYVGVTGTPARTRTGELSILPGGMQILAPCMRVIPAAFSGLKDIDIRYRQRYLDLIVNENVTTIFKKRAQFISALRQFLEDRNFLEVETPMLHRILGGASAKPFKTHYNALESDLFMRIAPELYLKMLVVGGMDRVYEIGKNFRNEGMDMTHNPEFTSCEFYAAYLDMYDLMDMTEELVAAIVNKVTGSLKVPFHLNGPTEEPIMVDFSPPYRRISMVDEIEKKTGITIPHPYDGEAAIQIMIKIIRDNHQAMPVPPTPAKLFDKLCGMFIEEDIVAPTFIMEHPQVMSPLAKWHRSKPEISERAELFICGREVANFYTELNDPAVQLECFKEQLKAKEAGDEEACGVDNRFINALEYGLPPTAGWGMGIDRMVMLLTDTQAIKEVILFPAMRDVDAPKKEVPQKKEEQPNQD